MEMHFGGVYSHIFGVGHPSSIGGFFHEARTSDPTAGSLNTAGAMYVKSGTEYKLMIKPDSSSAFKVVGTQT